MYRTIARLLTSFFVRTTDSKEVDKDIIAYGLEMLISTFITTILTLACGILFHRFAETLVFLVFFCPLRERAGGLHAKNYIRCTCTFLSLYLFVLGLDMVLTFYQLTMLLYISVILFGIVIYVIAPVEAANKPLTQNEKVYYRKQSRLLLLLEMFAIIIGTALNIRLLRYGAFALLCVAILLLIGLSTKKEDMYHEERKYNDAEEASKQCDEIGRENSC